MSAAALAVAPKRIVWQPQPKQAAFLARPEYEGLYGGAAGGGKSDALLAEALRQVHIPWYRAIIFRRTFPDLADLIDRSLEIYPFAFPRAKYNGAGHFWLFPSGAKIYFGSMPHDADRFRYRGRQFDFIGFDELTLFSWEQYSYMFSRNRAKGPNTRVYIRSTTNPGGIGHGWVKDRFVTAAPPMTPIKTEYEIIRPDGSRQKIVRYRVFVPATVFDNKMLLTNDPMYLARLAMMPAAYRDALLYGSWDSFEGQCFREWTNDPAHYDDQLHTHVIKPFPIPKHWPVYRSLDWGYSKPYSVGWYTMDEDGRAYRIAEMYGCTGEPNVGVQQHPSQVAAAIAGMERDHPLLKGRKITGVADPSIFDVSRGPSIAEMMAASPNFIYWEPGDNTRIPGKMQYHYRLAFDADDRPMLYVFNTCTNFIRTLPTLVYDPVRVEDVDTKQEDHIYDECRYLLMSHPMQAPKIVEQKPKSYDPLDLWNDPTKPLDKYKFYRI